MSYDSGKCSLGRQTSIARVAWLLSAVESINHSKSIRPFLRWRQLKKRARRLHNENHNGRENQVTSADVAQMEPYVVCRTPGMIRGTAWHQIKESVRMGCRKNARKRVLYAVGYSIRQYLCLQKDKLVASASNGNK